MSSCPYDSLPPRAWWRWAVANTSPHLVMANGDFEAGFLIAAGERVATVGSCFAQEIARRLSDFGLNHLVTEPGPERLSEQERQTRQYGTFSARYGNVYTTAQFRQLIDRAYGRFLPSERYWTTANDRFIDPYRPSIEPGGFSSLEELLWDRDCHLARVREMLEQANVIVFTLGLTESWRSRIDGAVFPVCPGCGFGTFEADRHEFHNMSAAEVLRDLGEIHERFRTVNPRLRMVLTVSPVPLVATMSGRHVLSATAYSKSVLLVAAQEFASARSDCCYFPSFEIVTGAHARGGYFHENLRTVSRHGVEHVMRCFARAFLGRGSETESDPPSLAPALGCAEKPSAEAIVSRVICDEETLEERYAAART